ncbi:MAG: thiolase family protein, partial [Proteobacteria bacterium]|nr:thiolase family protein [Pseudomonadota bacterium]
ETGGSVGGSACHTAVHHVASGACDVALVTASTKGGGMRQPLEPFEMGVRAQTAMTAGMHPIWDRWIFFGPLMLFAFMAHDYLMWSGCTREAIAKCRVKASKNAMKNPYAHLKKELTVEQVLESPTILYPLRLLEFCPISMGSAAMIFASEDVAEKITNKPVWVEDMVTSHSKQYWTDAMAPTSWGSQEAGAVELWKRNGITNPWKEIDVFEMYEPSTWAEVIWMEWMHLCDKGEAWKLVDRGATEIDGEFPINPSGGVSSKNPGVPSTVFRYIEAALQVRGDAGEHQVPRKVRRAVGHGFGGTNWNTFMLFSKNKP